MRIILNGEQNLVQSPNLEKILYELGYNNEAIATALNGTFIHKHKRSSTDLEEDDRLEVVAPIQGG